MKPVLIAAAALAAIAITPGVAAQSSSEKNGPWHNTVEVTERGHLVGDPDAETTLIEFVSYTCSTCAAFARQGAPALDYAFLSPGHVQLEIRPVIRNKLDVTVSLLVACGDTPDKFKRNHSMFLLSQKEWLDKAVSAPRSQQAIWARGDSASRGNMASALGLDDMMRDRRGYSASEINRCLRDDAKADKLDADDDANRLEYPIPGTPTFAIDGTVFTGVFTWETLYPALSDAVKAKWNAKLNPASQP